MSGDLRLREARLLMCFLCCPNGTPKKHNPEWYYLETENNALKDWLKCRTVGLCMCFNRLLNFHPVRPTRPCQYTPGNFIGNAAYRNARDPGHIERVPDYPDPQYFLSYTQKYFFRHSSLRHLRVEQFTRYLAMAGERGPSLCDVDDTVEVDDDAAAVETSHRNYDAFMESTPEGTHFLASCKHVPGCRRRRQSCLGVSRLPFAEPIGHSRENFFEYKLTLNLAWFCPTLPEVVRRDEGSSCTEYTFQWDPPADLGGQQLESVVLKLGHHDVSFSDRCAPRGCMLQVGTNARAMRASTFSGGRARCTRGLSTSSGACSICTESWSRRRSSKKRRRTTSART